MESERERLVLVTVRREMILCFYATGLPSNAGTLLDSDSVWANWIAVVGVCSGGNREL